MQWHFRDDWSSAQGYGNTQPTNTVRGNVSTYCGMNWCLERESERENIMHMINKTQYIYITWWTKPKDRAFYLICKEKWKKALPLEKGVQVLCPASPSDHPVILLLFLHIIWYDIYDIWYTSGLMSVHNLGIISNSKSMISIWIEGQKPGNWIDLKFKGKKSNTLFRAWK